MARKNRNLSTAFGTPINETAKDDVQVNSNTENQEVEVKVEETNENEAVEVEVAEENETDNAGTEQATPLTVDQVSSNIKAMYEERAKKKTVEDTHTRATFLIQNDLLKRLDKLAKNKRGYKTMVVNKALEVILDDLEK